MTMRPTPSQERWLTLARRFHLSPERGPLREHTGGWRTANIWSRCACFVLGLVAAAMIGIIGNNLWPSSEWAAAGIISVVAAEWLILGRRHFSSGIEESLEVAGLTMLAIECWSRSGSSEYMGAAFLGIAFAVAGLRLLNPIFTTLSALAFVLSLNVAPLKGGFACYFIGLFALLAGRHLFRRPSYDLMLDYLVIVMPVAGYLWSTRDSLFVGTDYLHAGFLQWVVPASCLIYAAIVVVIGLRRRTHAPIIASMLCIACAAYEFRRLTGLPLETRLILWGCVLLLISVILERYLRVMRHGITSRQVLDNDDKAGILSIFGSAILTPQSTQLKTAPLFQGGGGQFGGGGASGKF